MPVNSTRKEYDRTIKRWRLVRDVVDSRCDAYIPDVDKSDTERNIKYKAMAQLTNFTSRTKAGLLGAVFRKDAQIELPKDIEYLREDATGYDMSLNKLAQECTGEVLQSGRYGLLVDYPASERDLTQAQIEELDLKARIYRYKAESIINWNTDIIVGKPTLTLVVLEECINIIDPLDGFQWKETKQYRVLRLTDRTYTQEVYNEEFARISATVPTDFNGNTWDYIPFVFIGSEDNDSEIDNIPLYDLAKLNIGHLTNSADYEESVHIVGQPTLIMSTEIPSEVFENSNPGGIKIGARKGYNLGPGGKAEFLQANPNQLADEAMQRKEIQAVMIGARLITPQADRETATAASMRHSGETSVLSLIASNVAEGLTKACKYALKFMSADENQDVSIGLNDKFFDQEMDPNLITAQIQLLDKGVIATKDVRDLLKQYGVLDSNRSDEELDSEATPLPVVSADTPNKPFSP